MSVGKELCLLAQDHPSLLSPCRLSRPSWVHKITIQNLVLILGGLLGDFITSRDDLNSSILAEYKDRKVNTKDTSLGIKIPSLGLSLKELYTLEK